jgi:type IV pilus assembly protein PilE
MTTPSKNRNGACAGFTLVELMVTIVVATILISIAIPSYQSQMRKSRRTEAKTALLDLAAREERYYSTNSAYTNDVAKLGYSGTGWPLTVGSGYYQVTVCVAGTSPCTGNATSGSVYLLTATPVSPGPQAGDTSCASFTLDNAGQQSATNSGATTNLTCWN